MWSGGTGSNIWDARTGHFLPIPETPGRDAYHKYRGFVPFINDLPIGTMSAASFLVGLGGRAKKVIWDLNVFTFNTTEACDQIRYIAGLPGQQEPGVLLEREPPLLSPLSSRLSCSVLTSHCRLRSGQRTLLGAGTTAVPKLHSVRRCYG
jgi:hypothetical protein